jgi:hypothetical protein
MEAFAQSIEGGIVYTWVTSIFWLWPLMETLHFIGLSLLLGGLIIIDTRMAGFFRGLNITATHKLLPWVFVGFGINLTTGVLFFFGDPMRYAVNWGFRVKMVLVVIAGLNALWFWVRLNKPMHSWEPHGDTPGEAKLVAWISLVAWTGVLLFGRLIPYVGTG